MARDADAVETEREYNAWKRKSTKELRTHLSQVRSSLQKYHMAVQNALDEVPDLINQEVATLRNLETKARNKTMRKSSKESLDKAKDKVAKVSMNNQLRMLTQRVEDYGESVSDSGETSEEDLKVPAPTPDRRRRRSVDERVTARPLRRAAPSTSTTPVVQEADRVPYPPGLTAEEVARLDAWSTPSFAEFCFKEKYGYPKLQMLKAKGCPIPFIAPPDYYDGPEVEEQKARAAEQVSRLPSRQETRASAQAHGTPLNISSEERQLRAHVTQHGIEDLRTRIPVMREAPVQEVVREMEVSPDGSGSDSDVRVTPAMDSMRVGG